MVTGVTFNNPDRRDRLLSWLQGGRVEEIAHPAVLALPPNAPRPAPINVTRPDGWHVTDRQLGSDEKCPRRYIYTHVVGLGSAWKATAFSRTHDCLYELIA